jgi:hypothetical protein
MNTTQEEETWDMNFVKANPVYIKKINDFIQKKQGQCSLKELIDFAQARCPELKRHCEENRERFISKCERDKGIMGKMIEFFVFGNLPNNSSQPDLVYADIKATHFKRTHENHINAKERLTITNIGDTAKEEIRQMFQKTETLDGLKHYEKIKKGIILIAAHEKGIEYKTIEDNEKKKIIGIVLYDLNELGEEDKRILSDDYKKIRDCILEERVSQKGQQYLHIHKHGSKNSETRAFGFTNKFLTRLVAFYLEKPIIEKGKSTYFDV